MKHLWRNAWLLLAALLLLLTVALAADGAETEEIRFLTQEEKIEITQTDAPDQPKLTTLPPGTLVWPHVPGANQYQLGLYSNGVSFFWPLSLDNSFYLIDCLPSESAEITVTVQAIDEENADIENGYYEITFSYVPPTERLAVPNVKVTGSVLSVEPVEHAKYYEVIFQVDGSPEKSCGYQTSEALISQISVPAWFVEEYPDADFVVHVRAVSPNPLQYLDSEWSAFLEIDRPEKLPQVTGLRMLTATETVTVHSYREGPVTRTLYPGSLVWDPVEGDVSYMVRYYREIDGDRAVQIGQVSTEDAFFPVDLLWTTLGQGTYYATVTVNVKPNSAGYLPSEPVQTASWTLAETPQPLPVPSVTVTGSMATVSGSPENVARYNLQVLARESNEALWTLLLELSDPTFSVDEYLVEDYPNTAFSVRAQAVALDPTQNTNSDWSIAVPIDTPERLETPANVRFITEPTTIETDLGNGASYQHTLYPGSILWDPVEGAERYSVAIYRNGVEYQHYSTVSAFCDQWWYPWEQLPSGTYTAQVWAARNDGTMLPSAAAEAGTWVYTQPATKLQKPANLRWEGAKAVTDPVANAENYYFVLYYSPTADGTFTAYPAHYREQSNVYDFTYQIQELGNGYYYFKVTAYCNDVTTAVASPVSDASETLHVDWEKLSTPANFRVAQEPETVEYTHGGEAREVTVCPGFLAWDPVDGATNYLLTFYPAGDENWIFNSYVEEPCWHAFYDGLLEPGASYDVTLEAVGASGETMSSDRAVLQSWTYTVAETALPAPTVTQQDKQISFSFQVSSGGVYSYQVEFWRGADRERAQLIHSESTYSSTFSIPDYIAEDLDGDENYYVRVLACSNDLLTTADSGWSQMVWLTAPGSVKETISQVEQIVMKLPPAAELEAVQTELQKIEPDKLQTALAKKPAETAAQIAQLEKKVGVEVAVKGVTNAQVVGLGLSAKKANTPVTLTITRTAHDGLQLLDAPEISSANFQSATDVTFEAENVKTQLVVPVLVSLPAPDGDPDQLRLYQGVDLKEVPFTLMEGNVCFAVSNLNQRYVLAEANPLGEATVDDDGTVTVTVNAPDGTTLCAASYDASGKMLGVATDIIAAGKTSYTLSLTPDASVRIFLLDENQTPLCEAKTIQIP